MQDEAVANRRHNKEGEFEGYHAPDVALSEIREISRIFSIGLVAQNDESNSSEEAHRADGADNGRQPKVGHEQAVPGPADKPYENANDDKQRRPGARLRRHTHERGSQRHDRGDREIELAGNDEKRHRERDEALLGEGESEVGEREGIEKIRRSEAVEDEHGDRDCGEQRLPAHESAPSGLIETVRNKTPLDGRLAHAASVGLRMIRPGRRSPRKLSATATMMATPETAICQNGDSLITGSASAMIPRNSAPNTAPATDPTPPAIDTPPTRNAAMIVSSYPLRTWAEATT